MSAAVNLGALDRAALETMFADMDEPRFRARQVLQWIYQRRMDGVDAMTDLSKALRARLRAAAEIVFPKIIAEHRAGDGTLKWLLQLQDGNCIETVFIPEAGRGTLCISSQAGCGLNCTFCATARQGFNRNLRVDEIIGQLWVANRALTDLARAETTEPARAITNVVLMGMGEPLLNFANVVAALRLMMDDFAYGLSRRRITLSTAGLAPAIARLGAECPVSLAVSLHAPDDELREKLVPLNKKYPIAMLLDACRAYAARRRQTITFEYVMLDGVNDRPAQAENLARRLGDLPAKVNLIPFNPSAGLPYRRSSPAAIDRFRAVLMGKNIFTVTRKTRGDDIDAACGQLAGRIIDRTRRSRRLAQSAAH